MSNKKKKTNKRLVIGNVVSALALGFLMYDVLVLGGILLLPNTYMIPNYNPEVFSYHPRALAWVVSVLTLMWLSTQEDK